MISSAMKNIHFLILSLIFSTTLALSQTQKIKTPVRFLALGDSYTIGQSVGVNERWPVQLKDSLIARGIEVDTLQIIATTGWRTDNLINGINTFNPDSNFNLVSVLIGVNNFYQGTPIDNYVPDLKMIIDRAIQLAGNDTNAVFFVSIPDYAYTPFGGGSSTISAGIDFYNHLMDSVASTYGINYVYITNITREGLVDPSLVAKDNLHPSGKAYTLFVSEILKIMQIQSLGSSELKSINETDFMVSILNNRFELFPTSSQALSINKVEIYNAKGEIQISRIFPSSSSIIAFDAELPAGMYVVVLKSNNEIIGSKKVFVR